MAPSETSMVRSGVATLIYVVTSEMVDQGRDSAMEDNTTLSEDSPLDV